ncbi:glycosyltransferase [Oryzobacter telluris]|uniref:glycosyltransferase n=1 Tax=Oryzobacter telluris TaxID=3149179 RepID=UPI00370DCCA8
MTLAPARPTGAPTSPVGSEPTVTAVVITRRDPDGLHELLTALFAQTLLPTEVLVLDRTGGLTLPRRDGSAAPDVTDVVEAARNGHAVDVTVIETPHRTSVRAAAHRALAAHEGDPTTLAWFLPVGATPEPAALVTLVDTWRRSASTGIVGPKHVDADDPHLLRALSIHVTRGGRLLAKPVPGRPDQGQHDRDGDALAVPFAGSLVERDLLTELRGWETSFGDLGADLDLGWRAQDTGRRVVVAPTARVRSEPGVAPATASTPGRRRGARRVALTRASWWAAPALAAWIALTSVVAAVGLLLLKRPRAAWAELSSLSSLDPFRGAATRWRTRHRRAVARRDLQALFEPRRAVLTSWGDAVHDALVPPAPPIGNEANDLNPRSWLVNVVRHPGVIATAVAAVVAGLAARSLGLGVVTGMGSGLAGGELVGTRADAGTLWSAWTDGWTGTGLGGPDPVGPAAPLLALPAWLADHLPLLPSPTSPAGFVVALLVLLGMPLAAVSAYLSLRVMVRSRAVRTLGAVAWATTGVAAASVAQGRLGAVVALVLLPALAAGLWLIGTRRSTATSAFATALAGVLLGAFAPVLLAVVVVLALVLALVRRGVRLHALAVAVIPVAVLGPWLVRSAEASWPVLVAGVGLAQWGGATPEAWQLALLQTGGAGTPFVWTAVPLLAAALLAFGRGRAWGSATTALALLAPAFLALALVAPSVRLGTVPTGLEGAGDPITLWSGTLLLPFALVLVLLVARGLDGVRLRPPTAGAPASFGARTSLAARWTAVSLVVLAVATGAGAVVAATLGTDLAPWRDPRPAVSVEQASGAFATRALFVTPGDRGSGYRFVGREGSTLVRPLPSVAEADGSVAERVSAVLGDASAGPELFSDTATDLLAVRAGMVPEVTTRLDATAGLQRVTARQGWEMWRVSPASVEGGDSLVAPPRLRMETPTGARLVETTGDHAGTTTTLDVPADSRLVVAEPTGWAAQATVAVDGVVLQPADGTRTPTYALPAGPGVLTITVTDPLRWWHLGQVAAVLALAFLAVPFGRRESRVGSR